MSTLELLAAIIGSVMGSQVLVVFIQSLFVRRKTAAEADAVSTDNALKLVEVLTRRVDKLEQDLEQTRRENLELHKEVAALRTKLEVLGPK